MKTLDIVIVNWNAGAQLYDCVRSIADTQAGGSVALGRVVVVDNASTDGSADALTPLGGSLPLTILRNPTNRGFAAACNQGARVGTADYLLFLNPDTRVQDDALGRAVGFLDEAVARRVGIVGVQLVDETGAVARSCARFPSPGRSLAFMVRLDRLFPRRLPGHYMTEFDHASTREVDYARRASLAGWSTCFYAGAQVFHRGAGTTDQVRAARLCYVLRSRILYAFKHYGRGWALLHVAGTFTVECATRVVLAAARRGWTGVWETLRGYALLARLLFRHRRPASSTDDVQEPAAVPAGGAPR